jgi:hypothetical protein
MVRYTVPVHPAEVAQSCTLLYRGFAIRKPSVITNAIDSSRASQVQLGDTADYKSALRSVATFIRTSRAPPKLFLLFVRPVMSAAAHA